MTKKKAEIEKGAVIRRFLPLAIILLVLVAAYAMGWHKHLTLSALTESRAMLDSYVNAHPVASSILFVLLYIAVVATSLPAASLLTIAGGFLFGWALGGALTIIAATTGATLLFLAGRRACGNFVKQRLGTRTARLAEGFEQGAFGYLLILRLAPVFPFWLVNIVPAIFNVPVKTYIGATALGIAPATFAFAYLGHGLETALISAGAAGHDLGIGDLVTPQLTFAFAALAVVAAIPVVVKRLRGAKLP